MSVGRQYLTHESAMAQMEQTGATMTPERSALVTGAARGIGRAIAERLVADGLGVSVADLPSSQTEVGEWSPVSAATMSPSG